MPFARDLADQLHSLIEPLASSRSPFDGAASLTTAEVLAALRTLGDLSRSVDSLGAILSHEVTRRVMHDEGFRVAALGGATGGRAASELVRDLTGLDHREVGDWQTVADAIASASAR